MDYQKAIIKLQPDNELNREVLMAVLGDAGFESFVENETSVEAYIQAPLWNGSLLDNADFNEMFSIEWADEFIPDQNWNEEWEKNYFKPLLIADRCLVRAPFHTEYPKAEYEIVIEPKMAFGTGNHETTSLMVESILGMELTGKNVLDMGCGTGILSMLSSMMGAKCITAIDIDSWAYESTVENCQLNNCDNVKALLGDAALLGNECFDVVFANIHKNILLNDMPKYVEVLTDGGVLFMSGFYLSDIDDITNKAQSLGLKYMRHIVKNNWTVAVYSKL